MSRFNGARAWNGEAFDLRVLDGAGANSDGTRTETSLRLSTDMTFSRSWREYPAGTNSIMTAYVITGSGARFEIRSDTLVIHYLSYPADAPVGTSEVLRYTYLFM